MKFLLTRLKSLPGGSARPLREAEYVARPRTVDIIDPSTKMRVGMGQKRIAAEFKGTPPTFDSIESQRRYGWTDEDRELIERHLLTHIDYGRGVYLFPGEKLPEEYAGLAAEESAPVGEAGVPTQDSGKCKMVTREFPVEVCGADVLAGTSFCEQHFREVEEATAEEPEAVTA